MAPKYQPLQPGTNPNQLADEFVMVKLGSADPWPARIAWHTQDVLATNADGIDYDLVEAVTVWGGPKGQESWRTVPLSCVSVKKGRARRG